MQGTHIVIDIHNITNNEILKYTDSVIPILDDISNKFSLNVVNKAMHQFEPLGVTGVYILGESHLSVHTFVEERKVAMDLYTCTKFTRSNELIEFIRKVFDGCNLDYKVIDRL
jgi:S-adenosylmethionine decarboxylase proenzyme